MLNQNQDYQVGTDVHVVERHGNVETQYFGTVVDVVDCISGAGEECVWLRLRLSNGDTVFAITGDDHVEVAVYDGEDEPEFVMCPVCASPSYELGKLGSVTHYRCRNCGWTFNEE